MTRTAKILVVIVLVLAAIGIIMLYSTSAIPGSLRHHDAAYFLKRQAAFLLFGFMCAGVFALIHYRFWQYCALPLAAVALGLLALAVTPAFGVSANGSSRWIRVGSGLTVQPSDVAKFALIVLLAMWMSRVQRRASHPGVGLLAPLLLVGVFTALIMLEPDFGTTILCGSVGLAIMFVGGSRISHLILAGAVAAGGMLLMLAHNEERWGRIRVFLDPWKYMQGEGHQLVQSLYAFMLGGPTGVGLGDSMQKRFYIPEAHTDFILSIIGEELGLVATLGVVALFAGLFACGLRIALRTSDTFGRLLAFGITCMISFQAAINIGVVTGCLPTKGLPLPLISYGGTSVVVTLVMIGVLISVALHAETESDQPGEGLPAVRDRARRV